MKFFMVLIIIALISPLYAQSEEKDIEKRGIYGLGGAYGLSSISYRVPIVTKTIHTLPISGGYRGYGYGYGLGYGGYGNYFGW
ncbi:hypothetical protein QLX08_006186 [Tetragonisca angustula]|uniref:Uncharacterized protein n=1 Tax=Tetragonisca angustula TaxID=166442 RepID=A0AAW0ZW70_9HYME